MLEPERRYARDDPRPTETRVTWATLQRFVARISSAVLAAIHERNLTMSYVKHDGRPIDVARKLDRRAQKEQITRLRRRYDPLGEIARVKARLATSLARRRRVSSPWDTATTRREFDALWEKEFRGLPGRRR